MRDTINQQIKALSEKYPWAFMTKRYVLAMQRKLTEERRYQQTLLDVVASESYWGPNPEIWRRAASKLLRL